MLEQLFGSRTRTKLLHLFLENPDSRYFVREITRAITERINSVRRELDNLQKFGLIVSKEENQKKYFQADRKFVLFNELKTLIEKSKLLAEKIISSRAQKLEGLKYLVLTGVLVQVENAPTDVLLVGNIKPEPLQKFIKELERAYRLPIRYTYLTQKEYNLRKEMTDKFLYTVLNGPKVELVNKLNG
jgi:predicted transcriptional regulator